MTTWQIIAAPECPILTMHDSQEARAFEDFVRLDAQDNSAPLSAPLSVKFYDTNEEQRPLTDVIRLWGYGHVLVFRKRAHGILGTMIEPYVNIKLLNLAGKETLSAISIIERVECIDTERTRILYRPDGGIRIVRPFENLTLRSAAVVGKYIFCIDVYPFALFVSNEFKVLVEEHGLTGLSFRNIPES